MFVPPFVTGSKASQGLSSSSLTKASNLPDQSKALYAPMRSLEPALSFVGRAFAGGVALPGRVARSGRFLDATRPRLGAWENDGKMPRHGGRGEVSGKTLLITSNGGQGVLFIRVALNCVLSRGGDAHRCYVKLTFLKGFKRSKLPVEGKVSVPPVIVPQAAILSSTAPTPCCSFLLIDSHTAWFNKSLSTASL